MKKSISLSLALIICLSINTFAFASTPYFTQTWTTEALNLNISPEETTFTISPVPANSSAPVPGYTRESDNKVKITVPTSYSSAGEYKYTITQTAGKTQGMNYDSGAINLCVLVTIDKKGYVQTDSFLYAGEGSAKKEGFVNSYDVRSLSITQSVTGNIINEQEEFTVKVTFTPESGKKFKYNMRYSSANSASEDINYSSTTATTKQFTMKAGETLTINNIPVGVTYLVENISDNGYQTEYNNNSGTVGAQDISVNISNTRNSELNVGVVLETAPYLVILAVVAGGIIFLIHRQKKENRKV